MKSRYCLDNSNRFPDEFEIRDTLITIRQMGGTATRCFTLSVRSKGDKQDAPVYIKGIRQYNEEAFRTLDKVLQICNELDIRLIFPLSILTRFGDGEASGSLPPLGEKTEMIFGMTRS